MELFNADELARLRDETFVQRVEHHETLGSTNDRCLELSRTPHLETPLLVLAEEQTSGRGRGANRWWSASGALTFSLMIEPAMFGLPQMTWPRIAIASGLALCRLLDEYAPHATIGLKWPNDVWLNDRKIAGILVEVPPALDPAPQRIVIGMGINLLNSWQNAPEDLRHKGIALCDVENSCLVVSEILSSLLKHLQEHLEQLAQTPELLAESWQKYCVLTGRIVTIQQGEHLIQGECLGIAQDGAILLRDEEKTHRLYAGIVSAID